MFQFVLNKLLLLEVECPLCLETRSALSQICTGVFFPMILAPLANFSVSINYLVLLLLYDANFPPYNKFSRFIFIMLLFYIYFIILLFSLFHRLFLRVG